MVSVYLEDISLVALVTVLLSYQLAQFARKVGNARREYKINPPAITGHEKFDLIYRAQQNTLEFAPLILPMMWITALFFNQYVASILGVVYLLGRYKYMSGYSEKAELRRSGFKICAVVLRVMLVCALAGLAQSLFLHHIRINLKEEIIRITGFKF